jgi:hypothetical protein
MMGTESKILEQARFLGGNNSMTVSIVEYDHSYENEHGGKVHSYDFRLHTKLSTHGANVEFSWPLGSAKLIRWLRAALDRTITRMDQKKPYSYLWDETINGGNTGHPMVEIADGEPVPPTAPTNVSASIG